MEERPAGSREERTAANGGGEPTAVEGIASAAEKGGSGWITTDVAAAALNVSPRTVRDYIAAGRLAARSEGTGVQRRHLIEIGSLQALLDRRRQEAAVSPQGRREDRASMDAAITAASSADASAAETIRDLVARLEARSAEAADARARLELTERAESTLREELERERRQREEDVERERAERLEVQQEAQRLREELEAERSKGFWRRLFGG